MLPMFVKKRTESVLVEQEIKGLPLEQRLPEGMGTVDSPRESPSVIYTAADTIIPMASLDGEPRPPMEKVIGHYDVAPLIHPCHDYFRLMAFPPITSQVAVIREGLESINGFDDKLCIVEDTDCWMRILQNFGGDLIQCDAVGGFHRLSEFNTTTQGEQTPAQREDFIASGDVIRERHPRPTPQVIIEAETEIAGGVYIEYSGVLLAVWQLMNAMLRGCLTLQVESIENSRYWVSE